ncbi:ArsR/SmtB family transcription factor [Rhodococcus sp. NPDC003382]|uniref:ArsR/SmtB family transcription factor n=1 Tax=unclassified Rhodococcus (in: high G+C Gram-positive bacteria) TaxID=192944 RepID=UPI00200A032C|nr:MULTISPECIES: metalloregulator ArsR/SmtB family transcription factor [unclassified Rhodococcus (in: high G+C Gram-positive bacteria)]MCK8673157.1 metalloregulator ArsR/SmtB family transcription factor [Rhodococcus sp. HM1]
MESRPVFDPDDVRRAEAALRTPDIERWAQRFELLSDVNRLRMLLCLHHAPGIRVTDLATALGMTGTAVSHALRLLRDRGWVSATRDGRAVRYRLVDDTVHEMLHSIGATHQHAAHSHEND